MLTRSSQKFFNPIRYTGNIYFLFYIFFINVKKSCIVKPLQQDHETFVLKHIKTDLFHEIERIMVQFC